MNNTFVYLIGHYGVGKLTIAKALCQATGARLFDNHLANNVIFSLIRADGRTPLPERVWHYIGAIREQAMLAISELAPPEASFVLTNALMQDDARDHAAYARVAELARLRDARLVPVLLRASDAAHADRIASPERSARMKMTDVEGAAAVRKRKPLLRVDHPNRLDLDTTDLPPDEAVRRIVAHAEHLP